MENGAFALKEQNAPIVYTEGSSNIEFGVYKKTSDAKQKLRELKVT